MSNQVMKLEDIDGFDYESEYDDGDADSGGGILSGTTRIKYGPPWMAAVSKEPMAASLELMAAKVERVIIRFHGTDVPETRVLEPGEKFPNMKALNDSVPRTEWATDFNGNPKGPWEAQHVLFLLNGAHARPI